MNIENELRAAINFTADGIHDATRWDQRDEADDEGKTPMDRLVARIMGLFPGHHDRPTGPGRWVCTPSPNANFRQVTFLDLMDADIERGAPFYVSKVYGPIPELPTRPLWRLDGKPTRGVYIPKEVAICPECQGELQASSMEWDGETGQPTATGIELECTTYLSHETGHRWTQDKWQPVRDAVAKWCGARSSI